MAGVFAHKSIVIVGAGSSGLALVVHLCRKGAKIILSDRRQQAQVTGLERLAGLEVTFDFGGHNERLFTAADLVVVSPGVPLEVPAVAAARRAGVPVLGEVEIAWLDLTAPVVAITGTNGKSTTTVLSGNIFSAWGKKTFVGGNLGTPLVEAATVADWDYLVVELSSFQLETVDHFRPRYAMLLNISEDHLDRYADMAAYIAAKARIFENMGPSDVVVLNADDALVQQLAEKVTSRRVEFSCRRQLDEGMSLKGEEIVWRHAGREVSFPVRELALKGSHNLENVMAALIPPLLEGCPPAMAWQEACSFRGLPHRMEVVRTLDGVTYCNDSKATNVGSVAKSLQGLEAPVTLIAGGKDKGGDYAPLAELVKQKVGKLLLIGEAADRMQAELGSEAECELLGSLDEAVLRAGEVTPAGGMVLLSPGCSSFDMFDSFEQRGRVFTEAVLALPAGRDQR